jgi:diguanylate cyclase (GGDEF)-like protein/PAS domain S-box-containing protein
MYFLEAGMADREELVEAALEVYREGLALLDNEDRVVFWNRVAETITGYSGAQVLGRAIPGPLEGLTTCPISETSALNGLPAGGTVVHAQHQRGHDLPAVVRRVVLRDGLGERIGMAAVFHNAEQNAALPHGATSDGVEVKQSQADLQERLETEYQVSLHGGAPLGVLWITVDRAHELRGTHGARACESMLEAVERTLANSLLAGEEVGRWGNDEFLVMAREGAGEILAHRAQALVGAARTADFRWWGDRVSITVSIGLAVGEAVETLAELLERARMAMEVSVHAGGNHVTVAPGRHA